MKCDFIKKIILYIHLVCMHDTCIHKHPSIHCSVGSTPPIHVGVQCPLTSSLGEFPGYYDWALARIGVHRLFLWLRYIGVFPLPSSSPAIELHSCFFFTTGVSAPIGRPFTYSFFR